MSRYLPDRWLNYSPIGERIEGTRFIAFKVPLPDAANERVAAEKALTLNKLVERVPNLGIIIDLTNKQNNAYYNPEILVEKGIEHLRVKVPGHVIPTNDIINKFKLAVLSFINKNSDNDKLIGVHCTHGVNRTGFMICHFMITELSIKPADAILKFNAARGHKIERSNYLQALHKLDKKVSNRSTRSSRSPKSSKSYKRNNASISREERCEIPYNSALHQKHPLDNWRIQPLANDKDTYKLKNVLRHSDSDVIQKIYEANFPPLSREDWRARKAPDYEPNIKDISKSGDNGQILSRGPVDSNVEQQMPYNRKYAQDTDESRQNNYPNHMEFKNKTEYRSNYNWRNTKLDENERNSKYTWNSRENGDTLNRRPSHSCAKQQSPYHRTYAQNTYESRPNNYTNHMELKNKTTHRSNDFSATQPIRSSSINLTKSWPKNPYSDKC